MFNIKAERVRLGLSRDEVAKKLGVHVNTLALWESCETKPNSVNLINLSNFYKCSPDWLLGISDERTAR